jgi:hypothetical protein
MNVRRPLSIVLALGLLGVPASAALAGGSPPNSVLTWNQYTVESLLNAPTATPPGAGQAPGVATIHFAMVHGAIYDAVNSIDGTHEALLDGVPRAPTSASLDAAVATAAHHVLVGLVPALPQGVLDRLNTLYAGALLTIPDGQPKADGIAAGAAAADAMLVNRSDDGRYGPFRFTEGTDPGEWRTAPPAFVNDPNAWLARVRPFTLKSTSQYRTEGPPALTSDQYTVEYNEVKTLGPLTGSARSDEQNATATFFTENPVPLWYRTFRSIALDQGLTVVDAGRLFGILAVAGADSVIGCWDNKAFWSNWRPITAIRLGDADGNPATVGQADWTPLVATPPYPDVASGYNCYTGAIMYGAGDFFGTDRITFTAHSSAPNAVDRTYTRFSRVLGDTIDARVFQGIHFRSADEQGAWLGKKVAHWVSTNEFGPAG